MPKKNIDLSYSFKDSLPEVVSDMKDKKMYPTFHVVSDDKIDFPHDGEMTVVFKKISSETREGENGNRYECTIEVHKIVSMYGSDKDAPYKRDKSAEESLDGLRAKRMKEKEDDDDEYDD